MLSFLDNKNVFIHLMLFLFANVCRAFFITHWEIYFIVSHTRDFFNIQVCAINSILEPFVEAMKELESVNTFQ